MSSVPPPVVLFLDVDGVLHPALGRGLDASGATFQRPQMELLKEICNSVEGVKIVITSNWRKYPVLKRMLDKELADFGITGPSGVFDYTEVLKKDRRIEICQWLKNNEPKKFVIIDDLDLADESTLPSGTIWLDSGVSRHFVHTDHTTGLTRETADKCIGILKDVVWGGVQYGSDDD
jgi:hypothetical protein